MKKILLLLFTVLALNAWAVDITYDYTDADAMAALGFTQEELTGYALHTTLVSDQYANMTYNYFAFLMSNLYLATPTEQSNTSGEPGNVVWETRGSYVIKKIVVQTQSSSANERIAVLSGNTTLTPTTSGTMMTYTLDNPIFSFTITMNEAQTQPPVIMKVTVTYEQDEGVDINATNFPDTNFRNYVLQRIDSDGNGSLSTAEADVVTDMSLSYKQIASLKGIEYFTKLEDLNCTHNNLTSLDVSHNTELISLACASNQIAQLDVSMLTQLEGLNVGRNQLAQLDVSQNAKLNLLSATSNQLRELNVSNNPLLEILFIDDNAISSIDVTNNPKLYNFRCGNNRLKSLNVVNNPELKYLLCNGNALTHLDLTYNPLLTRLIISGNNISGDAMTRLVESLPATSGTGEFVAYTENGNEGNEFAPSNALELIKKNWTKINYYDANDTSKPYAVQITEDRFPDANFRQLVLDKYDTDEDGWLQVSEMTVTEFYCENRGAVSTQGLEYFPLIETLGVGANQLTTLNVSGNPRLTTIWCYLNQLRGNGVSELVASLPTLSSGTQGNIYAIWNANHTSPYSVTTEGNDFGTPHVAAANAKGWLVRIEADNYGWAVYAGSDYIVFDDANTEYFCVARFDTNSDGKLSYAEAAAVTPSQLSVFRSNASGNISRFDEFQYFTGLTYLPENCFMSVRGMTSITLPKSLKAVSKNAFRNCYDLQRVTLPEGIKSIRDYAFHMTSYGSQLTRVNFPATLDSIGRNAFCNCNQLANIEYDTQSIKYVGALAFQLCSKLTSFPFDNVERIEYGAFRITGLTEVTSRAGHIGQLAFEVFHPITVTLMRDNMDVYDTEDDSQTGLHLPITGNYDLEQTRVQLNRGYFHEAYNATTDKRECLHPYIALERYATVDAIPFSYEVPVVLPQGSKIFIVTGLNHTEGEETAYSRSMTGNVVPANTGVVVQLPDRELYTDQYWYLTANPSATAIGNYSPNILKASVGFTELGSPDDVVRFSWDSRYDNGEYYYGWMSNPDVYWGDGC